VPANPPRRAASTVEHARRLRAPPVPASDPWCTVCGGHLYTGHPRPRPGRRLCRGAAGTGVHVHYAETRLPLHAGLPKLHDLPAEMGGSGPTVAE